jgi:hypothetical protein
MVQERAAPILRRTGKFPVFTLRSCLHDLIAKLRHRLPDYSLPLPSRILSIPHLLQAPHLSLHALEDYQWVMIVIFQTLVHLPVAFPHYSMRTGLKIHIRMHSPISQERKLPRLPVSPLFRHLAPIPPMTSQPWGRAEVECAPHR